LPQPGEKAEEREVVESVTQAELNRMLGQVVRVQEG